MIPRSILLILCLFSTFGWAAQTRLDMAGLVKLLLAQGYHDIREVELEGEKFEVDTLDADDQRVQLQVDANTGEITKKEVHRGFPGKAALIFRKKYSESLNPYAIRFITLILLFTPSSTLVCIG